MSIKDLDINKCFYWTKKIKKPDWIPGPLIVKLTRLILYPIIIASFVFVAYKTLIGEMGWFIFAIFAINLIASLIFFPIQIKLKNLFLANVDIVIIFSTLIIQIVLAGRYSDLLALMQIPHLIWVSIAAVLQFSITYLNK
jgi:tryptophan-rich sensory protein